MGTNYVIHQDNQHEISVDEHSNRFTFMFYDKNTDQGSRPQMTGTPMDENGWTGDDVMLFGFDSTYYLSPEQLANIAIAMLQVSLYWHANNKAAHIDIQNRVAALVS